MRKGKKTKSNKQTRTTNGKQTDNKQQQKYNKQSERTNRQRTENKQIVNIVRRENERERVLEAGGGGEHATLAERRHVQGAQSTQAAANGGAPKATPRFASSGRSG